MLYMKRVNNNFAWLLLAIFCLVGCRSKQAVVTTPAEPVVAEVEANDWSTMSVPVSIDVEQPMALAMSGHMVMERNKRIYVSMRVFGFEVAQLNLTPSTLVALVKQGDRMVLEAPIAPVLAAYDVDFRTLQDAFLGDTEAINSLPKTLNISQIGPPDAPCIRVNMTSGAKALDLTITPQLSRAKWQGVTLAPFNPNLDGYRRVSITDLLKLTK